MPAYVPPLCFNLLWIYWDRCFAPNLSALSFVPERGGWDVHLSTLVHSVRGLLALGFTGSCSLPDSLVTAPTISTNWYRRGRRVAASLGDIHFPCASAPHSGPRLALSQISSAVPSGSVADCLPVAESEGRLRKADGPNGSIARSPDDSILYRF